MQLQCQNSLGPSFRFVFVGNNRGQYAIDPVFERKALGTDVVLVPVFLLDLLLDFVGITDLFHHFGFVIVANHGLFSTQGENAPKAFAVVDSRVSVPRFKIRLITADHPFFVGDFKAAVLDP